MDTRSGEILSAFVGLSIAFTMFTAPDSPLVRDLTAIGALPQWGIVCSGISIVCIIAAVIKSNRFNGLARFASGCVWGTLITVLFSVGQVYSLFWTSFVLFGFDIILVVLKGKIWTLKRRS